MAPVPPATPTNRTVSFRALMPPPPTPVSNHQQQRISIANLPMSTGGTSTVPQIQAMTLNVEHPGTYAITLDCTPCPHVVHEANELFFQQARQLLNHSSRSRIGRNPGQQ